MEALKHGELPYVEERTMTEAKLTDREQQALEHLRRAQELNVGLAEYARSFGVAASALYSSKQSLVRKGVIAGRKRRESERAAELPAGKFVPIQVVASNFRSPHVSGCQIRYPNGLIIECSDLPPASWIAAVVGGASDVSA